jgi:hypothetical protein
MACRSAMGDDADGPVAESVDARAVHRSLSWFESRPGLQTLLLAASALGSTASAVRGVTADHPKSKAAKCRSMRVKTLSRLRNLV